MREKPYQMALRLSGLYACLAALWILLSDRLLEALSLGSVSLTLLQSSKGLLFVGVTGALLYALLFRQFRRLEQESSERERAEVRVRHLNRVYAVLSDINQTIVRVREPKALFAAACRIAVEKGAFRMAWVGLVDPDTKRVEAAAQAGVNEGYLEKLNISLSDEMLSGGPTGTALLRGEHVVCNDIEQDPRMVPWREQALRRGYRASAALPLTSGGRTIGTFNLYASEPGFFNDAELRLLDELAADISFAVESQQREAERQRAEEALRAGEERFRLLAENIQEVLWVTETQHNRVIYVSPAYEAIWGRPCESLYATPESWLEAVHPEDRAQVQRAAASQRAGTYNEEFRIIRPDGAVRWIRDRAFPVRNQAGQVDRIVGVARDVTDRREVEAELRKREERFRLLIEHASDLITVINDEGTIRFQSPSAERLLGYRPEDMTGASLFEFVHPDDANDTAAAIQRASSDATVPVPVEYRIRHRDGSWKTVQSIGRSIPGEAAEGFIIFNSRDMTESRALEEQFRQSQKMEAIGRLAGGVAHDFNNIMGIIQMQVGLLKMEGRLSPSQSEFATEIGRAAQRASDLTRQLLLFSRREAMQPQDLNLNEIIANITRMLQRIVGEDVRMQFSYSPHPLFIHADAGMMDQVVLNLVVNSRDAMPKGGSLIIETLPAETDEGFVTQHPQARQGAFACLRVSDTGCGVEPDTLPRIFEPFFTTKDVGKGTGLGLATVFGIVQQHEGWIDVASQVGKGTTFQIYLPRLPVAPQSESQPLALEAMPRGSETILLVEDEASLCALVCDVLRRLGYHVLQAATAVSALEVWSQYRNEIHLLLTDMVMPDGVGGRDLAQQLLREKPGLKVIYISGYSPEIAGHNFPLREGVNYLPKPFRASRLAETVRVCLDGHRQ